MVKHSPIIYIIIYEPFNRVTDPRIWSKLLSKLDWTSVGVVDSLSTKPLILKPSYKFQNYIIIKILKK